MERPKRSFSLNKRPTNRKNRHIYYVRFRDENGDYLSAVSSGKTSKAAAETWALEQIAKGISPEKQNLTFARFVEGFWDYDTSSYIQRRLSRGFSYSRKYADICESNTRNHLIPEFGKRRLEEITQGQIDSWIMKIYRKGEIASPTVNKLLILMRIILEEAKKKGHIKTNPAKLVDPVKAVPRQRNILSTKEMQALFAPGAVKTVWNGDFKYMVINLLAASTGMRQGEIQGLQLQYIHDDYIEIRHSWEEGYGLKEPKNNSIRDVPIPAKVSEYIQELIAKSPYKEKEDFLFYGKERDKPLDKKLFQRTFKRALDNIGIEEKVRVQRNVTFHSWRHFFNTLCRLGQVPDSKLQRVTGHKTIAMTEHYTHFALGDFQDVRKVQEELFAG